MKKLELEKKVAYLEFVNDQLVSELKYIDRLLCSIGFPEGLETVKMAARELQEMEEMEADEDPATDNQS